MQTSAFCALSAISCALSSNIKSALTSMSVFHSFSPPISFSPLLTDDDIDNALVAAMNNAIELFFAFKIFNSFLF